MDVGHVLATSVELGSDLQFVIIAVDNVWLEAEVVLVCIAKRSAADFWVLEGIYRIGESVVMWGKSARQTKDSTYFVCNPLQWLRVTGTAVR